MLQFVVIGLPEPDFFVLIQYGITRLHTFAFKAVASLLSTRNPC